MINGQTNMEKEAEGYHNVQTETNEEQWNLEGKQDTEVLHLHEDNLVRIHRRVKEATKDDQEREENDNASNEVPNLSIADVNAIQSFFATMNKTGLPVYDLSSSQSPELSSERVGRRSKDAERKRLRRARETPEETRTRLDRASNYKRKKYSTETEEEYKQRLKKQAERKRLERANETEEQANIRRAKAAEHRRLYLQRETFEKTEERKAKDAERRRRSLKNETPEETLIRRAKNAQRRREALLKETPEEAAIRRARDAERRRQYLKSETEEQKAIRKAQDAARKRQIRVMKNQEHTEEQTGELPTSLSEALATLSELSGSFGPIDIRSIINPQIAPQFN